jgi:hypothetical protein
MQRLHDGDVSGDIPAREANYCHMCVPMYFEPLVYPASADGERTEDPETGEPSGRTPPTICRARVLLPPSLAYLCAGRHPWPVSCCAYPNRRVAFCYRPTPALADRDVLG